MKTLILLFIIALNLPILAGSADAVIRGKTESGRTEFEVRVGDIDGFIESVRLTIDGESYSIKNTGEAFQTVLRDEENGVYFLVLRTADKEFRLWMIPKSEKVIEKKNGVYRSRFGAVLEATDPRKSNGSWTPRITIGCTLDWEI